MFAPRASLRNLRVSVRTADGSLVDGELDRARGTWTPQWTLHPDTTYRVHVVAANADGRTASKRATFATLDPESTVRIDAINANDGTYGVGLPIVVQFTGPIENKKPAEQAMELRTSRPITGAWHWVSDEELHFRPKHYWPTGTTVALIAHLAGIRTDAGSGIDSDTGSGTDTGTYGNDNLRATFTIGDKHVSTIDAAAHTMTVTSHGEVVKTMPISAGDPEHPSSSGTFAAISAQSHIVMDSSSYGVPVDSPQGYRLDTYWNIRYTWSGQFVHSAPWSVGSQGAANVSHGCINASPSDAEWFYDFTQVGDIINVTGTPRQARPGNGWTDWNMPFDEYLDRSATGTSVHTLTMHGQPRTGSVPLR